MLGFFAASTQTVLADVVLFNGSEVAPNIAIFHVAEDGVYLDLEIYVDDVSLFAGLLPQRWVPDHGGNGRRLKQSPEHDESLGLSVIIGDGPALSPEIRKVEYRKRIDRASPLAGQRDPFSGQIVPSPPADPRVLFVNVFYPFLSPNPKTLTILPPSREGEPLATIGMQVFDRDVPVTDFKFLSKPAELKIHWADPWYSRFSAKNLNRKNQDGTSTFLYIEPREVRHETLIRLHELAPWIDETVGVGDKLSPQHGAKITKRAAKLLSSRNAVSIDGKPAQPAIATAELLTLTSKGFQVVEPGKEVSSNNAFVGAILSFPLADLPEHVTVTWDMFDEKISRVATISNDVAGPFFGAVTPVDPKFHWQNHLLKYERKSVSQIPVVRPEESRPGLAWATGIISAVSLLLVLAGTGKVLKRVSLAVLIFAVPATVYFSGSFTALAWRNASPPDPQTAAGILRSMIENLNTVNLETTPTARKAELTPIVTAASLDDIAAEIERGLTIRTPGGSLAAATDIGSPELERLDPISEPGGFQTLVKWSVQAEGGHWGHAHIRAVTFRALIEIVPEAGQWKLNGLTVIEARDPNA